MSIKILNATETSQSPIGAEDLKLMISEQIQTLNDSKQAARNIAQKLSTKSSKHKFLVSVTKIDSEPEVDADVNISSVVSAVWDEQKDGYWSFRVDDASIHLITVYWIHVD
ncbi:hypothetical protein JCM33374_g776 [Metschnikowia sp. JCM 33374]|nr:hypothetical protein JCM33374_g776 [Metschnikowia sp. JCM 33374]